MDRQSLNPVVFQNVLDHMLQSLGAAAPTAPFTGSKCKLFVNNIQPTRHNVPADFIEPTDTWYVAQPLGLTAGPYLADENNRAVEGVVSFQSANTPAGGTMLVGYFVTDGTGATLLMAERFSVPVAFAEDGMRLDLTVLVPEPFVRVVPQQ